MGTNGQSSKSPSDGPAAAGGSPLSGRSRRRRRNRRNRRIRRNRRRRRYDEGKTTYGIEDVPAVHDDDDDLNSLTGSSTTNEQATTSSFTSTLSTSVIRVSLTPQSNVSGGLGPSNPNSNSVKVCNCNGNGHNIRLNGPNSSPAISPEPGRPPQGGGGLPEPRPSEGSQNGSGTGGHQQLTEAQFTQLMDRLADLLGVRMADRLIDTLSNMLAGRLAHRLANRLEDADALLNRLTDRIVDRVLNLEAGRADGGGRTSGPGPQAPVIPPLPEVRQPKQQPKLQNNCKSVCGNVKAKISDAASLKLQTASSEQSLFKSSLNTAETKDVASTSARASKVAGKDSSPVYQQKLSVASSKSSSISPSKSMQQKLRLGKKSYESSLNSLKGPNTYKGTLPVLPPAKTLQKKEKSYGSSSKSSSKRGSPVKKQSLPSSKSRSISPSKSKLRLHRQQMFRPGEKSYQSSLNSPKGPVASNLPNTYSKGTLPVLPPPKSLQKKEKSYGPPSMSSYGCGSPVKKQQP